MGFCLFMTSRLGIIDRSRPRLDIRRSIVWIRVILYGSRVSQISSPTNGWELGTGPSLVVLDKGFGKNISTTLQQGVYAFIFNQKGLMAGIGRQGSKITKIYPNP